MSTNPNRSGAARDGERVRRNGGQDAGLARLQEFGNTMEEAGFSLPQPLRSKLHPMGLPHIDPWPGCCESCFS